MELEHAAAMHLLLPIVSRIEAGFDIRRQVRVG
jgi:hypothetical protein